MHSHRVPLLLAVVLGCSSARSTTPTPVAGKERPDVTPATPVTNNALPKRARQAVTTWINGIVAGDVDATVAVSALPFYLDGKRVDDIATLREELLESAAEVKTLSIKIRELVAAPAGRTHRGYGGPLANVIAVVVHMEVSTAGDTRKHAETFFVRPVDFKVVGNNG